MRLIDYFACLLGIVRASVTLREPYWTGRERKI
jgi:hypothetical protein